MAREQARKRTSSNNHIDRRTYLRLSGAVAVGTAATTLGDTAESAPDNRLSIVGTSSDPTTYEVTVTGEIVPERGTNALSSLGTTGRSAEDALSTGVRQYRFSGEIADLRLGEGAVALVNGVALD